ncbi:MAG: hypothetical protein JJE17_07395 [Peptostreptococcaceae bacterium]|nr:hypothetical protein [Peptostreptococcaceae bacterium]
MSKYFGGDTKREDGRDLEVFPFQLQVRYPVYFNNMKCQSLGDWTTVSRFTTLPELQNSLGNTTFSNLSEDSLRVLYKLSIVKVDLGKTNKKLYSAFHH